MSNQGQLTTGKLSQMSKGQFEALMKERIQHHQADTIHCSTCVATDQSECLPLAAKFGQHPEVLFLQEADGIRASRVFGTRAPTAFFSTIKGLLSFSSLGAIAYGFEHLEIKNYVVCGSSTSPTAHELVDFFRNTSTYENPDEKNIRVVLDQAKSVYETVVEVAMANHLDGDVNNLYKLAGLELTRRNLEIVKQRVGPDVNVAGCYTDNNTSQLLRITPESSLMDLFNGNVDKRPIAPLPPPQDPIAMFCSCCDSRSNAFHVFGGQFGQILSSNTVSVLIPPRNSLQYGQSHTAWAEIESAHKKGVPFFPVLGHSGCGGIAALINMKESGEMPGDPALKDWLLQALPTVDNVFSYLKNSQIKLTTEQLHELVTKEIKKWSAKNLGEYVGDKKVCLYYLEINSRNVQTLDPHESIEKTCHDIVSGKHQYLYYAPPPINIICPPSACPPRADRLPRTPHPNNDNFRWLMNPAA